MECICDICSFPMENESNISSGGLFNLLSLRKNASLGKDTWQIKEENTVSKMCAGDAKEQSVRV